MKTRSVKSALSALLAVSISAFSSTAFSALITQTDTYSTSLTVSGNAVSSDERYAPAFSFNAFDSRLGVLNQVIIDFQSTQRLNATLFNNNPYGGSYSFGSSYGNVAGSFSNGSSVETITSFTGSVSGAIGASTTTDVTFDPGTASENFVLTGDDLLPFIDTGPFTVTVGIFLSSDFFIVPMSSGEVLLPTLAGFTSTTDLEMRMTIQYVYEPKHATVPEPMSLILMGMGLVAACGSRRV